MSHSPIFQHDEENRGHLRLRSPYSCSQNNSLDRLPYHSKMADLLGSILNSMEKPPTVGDQESRRKARGTLCIALITSHLA